jgi:hypothetical protein
LLATPGNDPGLGNAIALGALLCHGAGPLPGRRKQRPSADLGIGCANDDSWVLQENDRQTVKATTQGAPYLAEADAQKRVSTV